MGFWKSLRAVLKNPDILSELEHERAAYQQLKGTLATTEAELDWTEMDIASLRQALERTTTQLDTYRAAIRSLCSHPPSNRELQQIYDAAAPKMDPKGFTLYRMAEKLAEIDVPSFFPYEDNRGLFEQVDGRQLLRYLTAARFLAVDWAIVPGTTYERAILREVDTSSSEYRAFERELYGKTLEQMGFYDVATPGQELKLYSRLNGQLTVPGYNEPQPMDGNDLAEFQIEILQGIEDKREEGRDLMAYFDGSDAVFEKVFSLYPSVEEIDGELFGVAVCRISGPLSAGELAELKEYCQCQYNDSWGEDFAQRPRRTRYGDLYVSFYVDNSDSILTKKEMDRPPSRTPRQPKDRGEHHGR